MDNDALYQEYLDRGGDLTREQWDAGQTSEVIAKREAMLKNIMALPPEERLDRAVSLIIQVLKEDKT